jgi:hypothetical protein
VPHTGGHHAAQKARQATPTSTKAKAASTAASSASPTIAPQSQRHQFDETVTRGAGRTQAQPHGGTSSRQGEQRDDRRNRVAAQYGDEDEDDDDDNHDEGRDAFARYMPPAQAYMYPSPYGAAYPSPPVDMADPYHNPYGYAYPPFMYPPPIHPLPYAPQFFNPPRRQGRWQQYYDGDDDFSGGQDDQRSIMRYRHVGPLLRGALLCVCMGVIFSKRVPHV